MRHAIQNLAHRIRFIVGDEALFNKFQKTLVNKCVDGLKKDTSRRVSKTRRPRRNKFGNSACMQSPNIKRRLRWLARLPKSAVDGVFQVSRAFVGRNCTEREFVNQSERRQLEAAYDFLLRARTELHYQTDPTGDVLGKNLQPPSRSALVIAERSPSKRIELHARPLHAHAQCFPHQRHRWEQRMALLTPPQKQISLRTWLPKRRAPEPVDGFLFMDGEIRARPPHFPG